MATFADRYGPWAVVAGASEGLGEALARGCAARGLNVVLIARRVELAQQIAEDIATTTGAQTRAFRADLADRDDLERILSDLVDLDVGLLVYNAAFSVVGPFWNFDIDTHLKEVDVNVRGPLMLAHGFGERFRARGRGGIILMSSMGALQGMVRVANYSATKAYNLVLAEGLWAELRDDGVDVLVSCAGATRTPNYVASEPEDSNVPVQEPEQVAAETLDALGKKPTLFPARVLRLTHFAFRHLTGRRTAVRLMAYASTVPTETKAVTAPETADDERVRRIHERPGSPSHNRVRACARISCRGSLAGRHLQFAHAPAEDYAMTVDITDLPTLSYDVTETPFEVFLRLREAQRLGPVAMGPLGPEVLSYDFARALLRDPRFVIPPGIHLTAQGVTSGPMWDRVVSSIMCMDGAEHHRLRSLVAKAFTPRATARMHDTIHVVVNELVDRVADAGRCDMVTDISLHYPIPIICALLGAPPQDWERFSDWANEIFKMVSFDCNLVDEEPNVMKAWGELDEYVDDMIADRRSSLTDDLLSDMIRAEEDGDRLSSDELRSMAASLLVAGTDTTRNQLSASVQVLCDHPEQWAMLRERPELAMRAVEETMRHSPSVCSTLRMVTSDVDFEGYTFTAGTFIFVNTFAANRDPAVYADPDTFDITREAPPAILTFGGGIHYCLGANLARVELAEALEILAHRMPNPRRVGPAPWKPMLGMSGPTSLTVEFGA